MNRLISISLLIVVAVFIGCDTQDPYTSPEQNERTAILDDLRAFEAEIAATVVAMNAEAEKHRVLTEQRLAARKSAPATRSISGVIKVPGDYDSIQEAVDAAAPGDVIEVRGTHTDLEVINIFTEGITLDGSKAHLKGSMESAARIQVFADDVRVTGFTLDRMRIWVFGGNRAEITNNNVSHTGSALAVFGGSEGSIIKNNHAHNSAHGLFLVNTRNNLVENNKFNNNSVVGIILTDGNQGNTPADNNTLLDNTVNGNTRGIRVFGSHGNVITDCTVNGSDLSGIVLWESTGTVITDCKTNGNGFDGILLIDSDNNEIRESMANGNTEIGIELRTSDNNTVADSKAKGNKTCDLVDDGVGNVFVNNKGSFNCN